MRATWNPGPSSTLRRRVLDLLVVLVLAAASRPAGAQVSSADEVCPADADPCSVTVKRDVADGAVLDFGTRTVAVSGSGQFNFGAGSGSILCGNFTASTSGTAIDANGNAESGGTRSGTVRIEARRRCAGGAADLPCTDLGDCQLGACGVRRCTLRPTRLCTDDAGCDVGPCGGNKRCAGVTNAILRCETNADCNFGTCPAESTCASLNVTPLQCMTNADCDLGACTSGSASIQLGGSVVGNSGRPAVVELVAADSVSVSKPVTVASTSTDVDGGELLLRAVEGSVALTGKVTATGGAGGTGGTVTLEAGLDVAVAEEINANGGDFDGGSIEITAARDVAVSRNLLASAQAGAGFGGEILVEAGRDLLVAGASSRNAVTLLADGRTDAQGASGDGGTIALSAGRHAVVAEGTVVSGQGASPDGSGSEAAVVAGGDLTLGGEWTLTGDGSGGVGGLLELQSGGALAVGPGTVVDLAGGSRGAGTLRASSLGPAVFAGAVEAAASAGGAAGSVIFDVDDDLVLSGAVTLAGSAGGTLDATACRIALADGAVLDHDAPGAASRLVARESMRLLDGSLMAAGPGGANTLVHRSAAKPPVVDGEVTPAAVVVLDETLQGCPVCPNGEVDQGETCDDGATAAGDGCSPACQDEGCLAGTEPPGWPAVPLCDDGDPCTLDTCAPEPGGGACLHEAAECDACGNGNVEPPEDCDDGDQAFVPGDACTADCTATPCGQPTSPGADRPRVLDSLYTLRTAVELESCALAVCDTDASGATTTVDALRVLRAAVGITGQLLCN